MRRFAQVDVFTAQAGLGNPVAVVLDADGLDDATMARIANWTNLSETTFVLPPTTPDADYRVRIFTPAEELPFAGHPTLGTCRALIDAGVLRSDQGQWIQECHAGLIPVRRSDGDVLSFAAPEPSITDSPVTDDVLAGILGGVTARDPLLVDVGPIWLTGRMSVDELDGLHPDAVAFFRDLDQKLSTGVNLYAVDDERTVHVRSFFGGGGGLLTEDPVCGSGNAAVGAHLRHTGRSGDFAATYQSRQGRHRGRDGRITVALEERIWVGGQAVTVVTGTIAL
jgi:PhzF family phenazine biosynthesis protein